MKKSELRKLIREELKKSSENLNEGKSSISLNQKEIELLIDALEYYMDEAPDGWFDTPTAEKILATLKSNSTFHNSDDTSWIDDHFN